MRWNLTRDAAWLEQAEAEGTTALRLDPSQPEVRYSLALTLASSVIGVAAGALQGFYGGWVDLAGQRFLEIWSGLPVLYLLIILASFVQPNFWWLLGLMLMFSWMSLVDVVRAEFLRGRNLEYVRAARALGMRNGAIMFRHILPNVVSPIIVKMSLDMGFAILTVAGLGFIGIGVRPPTPEWGTLLSVSRSYMPDYWWTAMAPGMAMFLAVFGFNLLGDGLRDVLDPKARR